MGQKNVIIACLLQNVSSLGSICFGIGDARQESGEEISKADRAEESDDAHRYQNCTKHLKTADWCVVCEKKLDEKLVWCRKKRITSTLYCKPPHVA